MFNYRDIIIPSEGKVFVKADYSGQELRNLAEVSKDKAMCAAFQKGYDLHLFTGNRVFNLGLSEDAFIDGSEAHKKACEEFKAKRHQAKNGVNFPVVYGAGAKKIAESNSVTKEEAQRWLDEFNALYLGVLPWKERVKTNISRNGYTTTLFGRRRRFPGYKKGVKGGPKYWENLKMERQAANFEIQGFSADQMKIAAVTIRQYEADFDAKLVMSVHDELVWELPKDKAEEFSKRIKYTMEHVVALSVPMIVEVKIVESYGQ